MSKNPPRRRLADPVPEWEARYVELKVNRPVPPFPVRVLRALSAGLDEALHPRCLRTTADLLACLDEVIDARAPGATVAVVGCGPKPDTVRDLGAAGFEAVGVEPVADAVARATAFLGAAARVVPGTAERMPLATGSQAVVLLENVLEHVDSVPASLAECFRILRPGGVLFVRTTNRHRISPTGINWEFTTPFFNWFPRAVRESYVFAQLHHRPELARYSPRPAVHWFTYADLCAAGRDAGFAQFYSPFDLLYLARRATTPAWLFRLRHAARRSPWLRAAAVSQMEGDIFMWKRPEPPA